MFVGIRLKDSHNCRLINNDYKGLDVAIDLIDSSAILPDFRADLRRPSGDHLKLFGKVAGRNQPCPCGSGVKTKKCKGASQMSTGIRSDNSSITVGKANIVADIGIDLKNKSHAQIEELNHYAPDTPPALIHAIKSLPVQPPSELVKDAIEHQKATGSIDGSKLWDWFSKQGINLSFWAQLSVAFAGLG